MVAVMPEPFSVLLPVWDGDRADRFERAAASVTEDQTLRPNQLIVVRDGPVHEALEGAITRLCENSPVPVTYLPLPHNVGLGPALDEGLRASEYDLVARADADDISMPHRFEVMVPRCTDADLVGAGMLEFRDDDLDAIVGVRTPPLGREKIERYARLHDPFNHPTIVYRRQAVVAAGGYGDLALMEDYRLFARMLANGARVANLPDPVVYYRVGATAYKRRGGKALFRSEVRLQREFLSEGFISRGQFTRNVAMRGAYRFVPWWLRRAAYRRLTPFVIKRLQRRSSVADGTEHVAEPVDLARPREAERSMAETRLAEGA
jgi:glycosyltransferase involved in cell wall biosynthesis